MTSIAATMISMKPTIKLSKFGLGRKAKTHNTLDDCDSIHSEDTPQDLTYSDNAPNSPEVSESPERPVLVSPFHPPIYHHSGDINHHRSSHNEQSKIIDRSSHHHPQRRPVSPEIPVCADSDDDSSDDEEDLYARFAAAGAASVPVAKSSLSGGSGERPKSSSSGSGGEKKKKRSSGEGGDRERKSSSSGGRSRHHRSSRTSSSADLGSADRSSDDKREQTSHDRERRRGSNHNRTSSISAEPTPAAPSRNRARERRPSMFGTATALPSESDDKGCDRDRGEKSRSAAGPSGPSSRNRARERRPSMFGTATASAFDTDNVYGYGYNEEPPATPQPQKLTSRRSGERRPSMISSPSKAYEVDEHHKVKESSAQQSSPRANPQAPGRSRMQRRMSSSALPANHVNGGCAFEEVYHAPPSAAGAEYSEKKKSKKKEGESSCKIEPDRVKVRRRSSINCAPSGDHGSSSGGGERFPPSRTDSTSKSRSHRRSSISAGGHSKSPTSAMDY